MTVAHKAHISRPGQGKSFDFAGHQFLIKASGQEAGGRYDMAEQSYPQGVGGPLHVHTDEDEALYVLEGEMTVRIGDQTTKLGPGGFVFGPRGIPHAVTNDGARPLKLLAITSPPRFQKLMNLLAASSGDMTKAMAGLKIKLASSS